jgi:hypothetical protein
MPKVEQEIQALKEEMRKPPDPGPVRSSNLTFRGQASGDD